MSAGDKALPGDLVPVTVSRVTVDPLTGLPQVILREEARRRCLAICIGLGEAQAITAGLGEVELTRPLPHDLLRDVVTLSGMEFTHVEIRCFKESGHCALIVLRDRCGTQHHLEARPSDAIALALRMGGKILIAEEALAGSRRVNAPARMPLSVRPSRPTKWRM